MALWGGRFASGPDALFRALNDSLGFDYRLAREDIQGSMGWVKAIHRAGVLSADEHQSLDGALRELLALVEADPALPLTDGGGKDEDIHSWVERRLIEKLGNLGKKLHTGRSRNDQVATDLRLWTRAQIDARIQEMRACRESLIQLAERELATVMPGYTHLQRAQPVLLAHWAMAYVEMFERDAARLRDARARVNVCPLGSGALAGTGYAIDREQLARDLQFEACTRNSLDGVSDRDFVMETLSACTMCAVHLSRLGEDLCLYGSQEFGFFEYSDEVSSGSSLMPQKKNPDAAELLRGKSGRISGALVSLLMTMKGLPLSYNKDLQEDKEPLFEAMTQLSLCLCVLSRILDTVRVRQEVCRRAAQGGYSNATDLADALVGAGVPFREAHEQAGRGVRLAISLGLALEELTLEQIRTVAPHAPEGVHRHLALDAGLERREVVGGTGPKAVDAAIRRARERSI
jgi:argininosuccinate lyase/amino-acid N-acetyltransferase